MSDIYSKTKEVYYQDWCPYCVHFDKQENSCPCEACLTYAWNEDSHRPLYFKTEKDIKEVLEAIAKKYEHEMELQEEGGIEG